MILIVSQLNIGHTSEVLPCANGRDLLGSSRYCSQRAALQVPTPAARQRRSQELATAAALRGPGACRSPRLVPVARAAAALTAAVELAPPPEVRAQRAAHSSERREQRLQGLALEAPRPAAARPLAYLPAALRAATPTAAPITQGRLPATWFSGCSRPANGSAARTREGHRLP